METNFQLGEKVYVTGRYEKVMITPPEVDTMKSIINKTGCEIISDRYELKRFDEIKSGIIVGKRTIATKRRNYRYEGQVLTEVFERETVYLVACDLRGVFYAPEWEVCGEDEKGDLYYWWDNYVKGDAHK